MNNKLVIWQLILNQVPKCNQSNLIKDKNIQTKNMQVLKGVVRFQDLINQLILQIHYKHFKNETKTKEIKIYLNSLKANNKKVNKSYLSHKDSMVYPNKYVFLIISVVKHRSKMVVNHN